MIVLEDGRLKVSGPMLMDNLCALHSAALPYLDRPNLVVDLAEVTEVDSAAVSLLLEWQREAMRRKGSVAYANLPANLESLAQLYGVTELIPRA